MRNCIFLFLAMAIFFGGCAGRQAYPVQSYLPGDDQKSCMILKAEMAQIENEIRKKLPKSDKTGSNVLLGTAGCFLIVPWFFMDSKGADKIEVEAFQRRYNALSLLAADKGCTIGMADSKVTGLKGSESVILQCSKCNHSGGEDAKWQMIDGKLLCLECSTKLEESKQLTKTGSRIIK